MTPPEYLAQLDWLVKKGAFYEVVALGRERLTDDLLGAMTPHERRLAASATHVAMYVTGEIFDPPTGIPFDDLDPEAREAIEAAS